MHTPHPLFQQKTEVLAALMKRTAAARAEAHGKCRFYVQPQGDAWAVVEATSLRLHGLRQRYPDAVRYAEQLEQALDKRDSAVVTVKDIGERMTRWASALGLVMVVWAIRGAA